MLLPVSNNKQDVLLERSPASIAIKLTERCNLQCIMCKHRRQAGSEDMPYKKVLSLLDEAYELGAWRFDPYGTELFTRDDMPDILAYADRIGFREIYVVSNGLLLNNPELLDKLAAIKSLVITVSIDGPKSIHDGLRGNGVYDRALLSLLELGQKGIKRSIASIIMRPTIDHLHKIVDLAVELKIPVISMQPFCRDLASPDCDYRMFEFVPDEDKIVAIKLNNLLKYARQKKIIIYTGTMIKHVSSYLTKGIIPFPPHGCHVPLKTMVVDIQGNSYPCFSILKNMGNVNEMSLSSIWKSNIHRKFAISAIEKKCPGCLMACSDVESYNAGLINNFILATKFTAKKGLRFIKKGLRPLRELRK